MKAVMMELRENWKITKCILSETGVLQQLKREAVVNAAKGSLWLVGLLNFFIPGSENSWIPVWNLMYLGFIYLVLKANIKGF